MTEKQKERCKWTTKKGTQCKKVAFGNTGLCPWHNITIKLRTTLIFFCLSVFVTLIILLFGQDIKRIIVPEKPLLEKIKIEGNNALKNKGGQQTFICSHKLHDLGIQALGSGDYDSYHEAIWQLLRLHEFCLTYDSIYDPTSKWREVSGQLNSLITAKRLEFTHCVQICFKLGEVALAGTKESIKDYNEGKFFSDLLFTGTLELMKGIIDTLWAKNDDIFADLLSKSMMELFIAEALRRQDQGYWICPRADDMLQMTITGERIANAGQPRELDSFYKACYIISRLPGPLFKELIITAGDYYKYYKLNLDVAVTTEEKADTMSVIELFNKWRYYHPYWIIGTIYFKKKPIIDSLILASNQKGKVATECVRQLLLRERNPKEWKANKF